MHATPNTIAQHSSCKRDRRVFCFTTYNIHIYICIFCFCSTIHWAQETRRKRKGFVSLYTIFLLRVDYPTGLSFPMFYSMNFVVCPISWFLMGSGGWVEVPGGKSWVLISHKKHAPSWSREAFLVKYNLCGGRRKSGVGRGGCCWCWVRSSKCIRRLFLEQKWYSRCENRDKLKGWIGWMIMDILLES